MNAPQTLLDKIWKAHEVIPETEDTPAILYIDRHYIHEVTSPQAFDELRRRRLPVRCPKRTLAAADHSVPTRGRDGSEYGSLPWVHEHARVQVEALRENCATFGIDLHDLESPHQGILHVMGPSLGASHPGSTIVCGDSHTSTHSAFGALAFGIGTTEVSHVLATQCLMQRKPRSLAVEIQGRLGPGVTAKDLILAIIRRLGVHGGTGHVIEYRGQVIAELSMDARMTICNMSIEAGARAGLMAPDDVTYDALKDRALAPRDFDRALARWENLRTDQKASFDRTCVIDASDIRPMVTWGTDPSAAVSIDESIPEPRNEGMKAAQDYMGWRGGEPIQGQEITMAFIGSCTNGRLEDLRGAAAILKDRRVHPSVELVVVPGSCEVKAQAETEGLHDVFRRAGAQWRHAGCSMCIAMNGDLAKPGQRVISTTNRNFKGRQGPGVRTILASPQTVAASAVEGRIADPRWISRRGES